MTEKWIIQRTRTRTRTRPWTKRARRAIPYGPFARFGDWWAAGRDARAGLPSLLGPREEGGGATSRMMFLGQLGRGRAEKEWLYYRKEIAGHLIPLTEARAGRDTAQRELTDAQERLAGLKPPEGDELGARRSGEKDTPEHVVRARRMQAYTERRLAAEASVRQLSARVAEYGTAVARLSEPIRLRFEVAKTRAELIDAYVRRRRASYLARLIRMQPEGGQASSLIGSDWPERPCWMARAVSPDLADPAVPGDLADPAVPGDLADAIPMGGN
jgi:hypothetical protein